MTITRPDTRRAAPARNCAPACRYCGRTIPAAPFAREHETGLHSQRVACHTQVLARRFTQDPQRLRQIYWGALLHDIGKIGIPDTILLKHRAANRRRVAGHAHAPRDRPYRKGLSFDAAQVEIVRLAGTQFDPQAVEAFNAEEKTLREMVAMKCGRVPGDAAEQFAAS